MSSGRKPKWDNRIKFEVTGPKWLKDFIDDKAHDYEGRGEFLVDLFNDNHNKEKAELVSKNKEQEKKIEEQDELIKELRETIEELNKENEQFRKERRSDKIEDMKEEILEFEKENGFIYFWTEENSVDMVYVYKEDLLGRFDGYIQNYEELFCSALKQFVMDYDLSDQVGRTVRKIEIQKRGYDSSGDLMPKERVGIIDIENLEVRLLFDI